MFGYIVPNRGELKVREWEEYRCWYCGLCHRLQKEYGLRGRLSLNYDMTFLAMLLSSLYDTECTMRRTGCVLHPARRQKHYDSSEVGYAASMNILLTYYKCLDDWKDDRNVLRGGYGVLLRSAACKVTEQYPGQAEAVRMCLAQLTQAEQTREMVPDMVSGIFGRLCGAIFAKEDDIWHQDLSKMGFYLGKFIYLLDAWEDLEQDKKCGSYNPFLAGRFPGERKDEVFLAEIKKSQEGQEKNVRQKDSQQETKWSEDIVREMLTGSIAQACRYFERLPIVENAEIFRNILYSGVWTGYRRPGRKKNRNSEENRTGAKRG